MYAKHRLFIQTSKGLRRVAAANTMLELIRRATDWLNSSGGRGIYDDQVQAVMVYTLNEKAGNYRLQHRLPASNRQDIINVMKPLAG